MITKNSPIEERVLHVAKYACHDGSVKHWRLDTTDRAINDGWCSEEEAEEFENIAQKMKGKTK